jgi:hypothetical protein
MNLADYLIQNMEEEELERKLQIMRESGQMYYAAWKNTNEKVEEYGRSSF